MDQLAAIRVFCRVAETGGFTSAADSLNIPKATASKLVAGLESHLRVKLLNRTTRSVQVTSEGAAYYERVSHWLKELSDIDGSFDSERVKPRGRIAIDASAWVASAVIVPALPRFYAEYPDIQIELGVSDRTIHLIRESTDCVVRGGTLNDQSMITRLLGHSRSMSAASPDYIDRHGIPASPEDLANHHLMINYQLATSGRPMPLRFQRDGVEIVVDGRSQLSVNESNAHLSAGLRGLGILYSFEWKLRPYIESGQLVEVLREWAPRPYPFHLLYPPNRFMSTRLRVFIDWLVTIFAEFE